MYCKHSWWLKVV